MKELLKEILPNATEQQRDQLCLYYQLLIEWNEKMNLTAITAKEDVAVKHFLDSLSPLSYPDLLPEGASCIDVGTGAGFPGIPLLIMRPDLQLTLLDSLQKRLTFLQAVLDALGCRATLVHARAEDGGHMPSLRGQFDRAVSRAVAPLPVLLELTVPFVKRGGMAIAYKGSEAQAELTAAKGAANRLGCSLTSYPCHIREFCRHLILAEKTADTPKQYPRKAGIPKKQPL